MAKKPNGIVIYDGPSRIDGQRIVAIVVGLARPSSNAKTGNMLQTYILRADVSPVEANRTGADLSICGVCPLKGDNGKGRACYVNLGQGPRSVWSAFSRGVYPSIPTMAKGKGEYWMALGAIGKGRTVRLGTYGDPAAVPTWIWKHLLIDAAGHTGYTHQWKATRLRDILEFCQASVDSCRDVEILDRVAPGAGYFRVLPVVGDAAPLDGEIVCPSLQGVHCQDCQLCDATGMRVVIPAHGIGRRHFKVA